MATTTKKIAAIRDGVNGGKIAFRPGERVRFALVRYRGGTATGGHLGVLSGVQPRDETEAADGVCGRIEVGRGMRALRAALVEAAEHNRARQHPHGSHHVVALYDHSQRTWWPIRAELAE